MLKIIRIINQGTSDDDVMDFELFWEMWHNCVQVKTWIVTAVVRSSFIDSLWGKGNQYNQLHNIKNNTKPFLPSYYFNEREGKF